MRQSGSLAALSLCALMLTGCGGGNRGAEDSSAAANGEADNPFRNSDSRPEPISTAGCLTGSNGRYVVTALDSSAPVPTTITYQLSGGNEADLQKHLNREVRVTGEADAARIADVRDVGAPAVGTTGERPKGANGAGQPEATVKTQEALRFEVRNLKVSSITPTGDECAAQEAR